MRREAWSAKPTLTPHQRIKRGNAEKETVGDNARSVSRVTMTKLQKRQPGANNWIATAKRT
jgi:hypothetical protein